ncbi:MAG TPA: hypothetical protein PKD68_00175 [Candidatus Saccharibacteria bacterium]|nr:hypothetical protein [Candidatus Saccharibacteria bacterium]
MSKAKQFVFRAIRKTAHLSNRAMQKTLGLTTRVEHKATRILDGTDFGIAAEDTIALEKMYYNSLKYITPINPALPKVGQKAAVVLFVPSLTASSFYGGTATALFVAGRLAELTKRPLRIVQTIQTGHVENLSKFLSDAGITVAEDDISISSVAERSYNVYGYLPMHQDDIFIASAWWDAYLINQLPLTRKFIYLIQDFEPIFYNNSDLYILAESTYQGGNYTPLCNTKLMYDFMQERGYPNFKDSTASYFEPAVSRSASGLVRKKAKSEKKKMFLYGRPNVHRNLFFTGLTAIDYAFKAGFLNKNDWELFMAGQDGLANIKLSSGVILKNLGKMEMQDYTDFSKDVDVAVSLMMAPHPNYPTLEFASVGAAVVTTKYANKVDLSGYSKNIVLSDIGVESIAGAINVAAGMTYESRMKNLEANNINNSWTNALDAVLKNILTQYR